MRKRVGVAGSVIATLVVAAALPLSGVATAQQQEAACAILPFDPLTGSFRGAGFGTPQQVVENVTVKAQDHAVFVVACESPDTPAFTLNVDYWFEAETSPGIWTQVSQTFNCSADSVPDVTTVEAAAVAVPSPGCDFKRFYNEDDPVIFVDHRVKIHYTTTVGNDETGTSLPWSLN